MGPLIRALLLMAALAALLMFVGSFWGPTGIWIGLGMAILTNLAAWWNSASSPLKAMTARSVSEQELAQIYVMVPGAPALAAPRASRTTASRPASGQDSATPTRQPATSPPLTSGSPPTRVSTIGRAGVVGERRDALGAGEEQPPLCLDPRTQGIAHPSLDCCRVVLDGETERRSASG
jgi:hypothetical protein